LITFRIDLQNTRNENHTISQSNTNSKNKTKGFEP